MTDTTEIAALRVEAENIIRKLEFNGLQSANHGALAAFFDAVFRKLEAERQRADTSGKEAAEWEVKFDELSNWHGDALLEIAALKVKLANPVVLKPAYRQSQYSQLGLEPSDAYGLAWGSSETRDDCVKQIREAGFTVKGV